GGAPVGRDRVPGGQGDDPADDGAGGVDVPAGAHGRPQGGGVVAQVAVGAPERERDRVGAGDARAVPQHAGGALDGRVGGKLKGQLDAFTGGAGRGVLQGGAQELPAGAG